jgi:hypothetical protein
MRHFRPRAIEKRDVVPPNVTKTFSEGLGKYEDRLNMLECVNNKFPSDKSSYGTMS